MNHLIIASALIAATALPAAAETPGLDIYPQVTLKGGGVTMVVFLPDAEKGYCRATRFEWSGQVRSLTCGGHSYFGTREHLGPQNPTDSEFSISLAEEFSIGTSREIPQRFTEAKPGETFMKIGAGNLIKPEGAERYSFAGKYEIADSGTWTSESGPNWVAFTHDLKDDFGLGYHYEKRMELAADEPVLTISHTITNTGTDHLVADQYCHNFYTIDNTPMAGAYTLEFPFVPESRRGFGENAVVEGKVLRFNTDKGDIFANITGYGDTPADNHVIMRNVKTGGAVEIGGDFPLSGFNLWSDNRTLCPELFTWFDLQPGESHSWTRTYRFFEEK